MFVCINIFFFYILGVRESYNKISSFFHLRGIDLESMNIGHRDALLLFRTLCKVPSHLCFIFSAILYTSFCSSLKFSYECLYKDGNEGRK